MKKIRLFMGLVMAAPILAIGPMAIAATNTPATSGSSNSSTNGASNTTTSTSKDDSSDDPEKAIEKLVEAEKSKQPQADRLKARIAKLNLKLTAAESAKLKTKCVAAQGLVKVLEIKVNSGITSRSKAYDELLSHLDKLIAKLKAANVSTSELETERTALKTKIDNFKKDLTTYKVALADVQATGCLVDPTGFKAVLEDARTSRKAVADDAAAIRSYVNDTIKTTLKNIKSDLEKNSTKADTSKTTTDTKTNTTSGGAQ